MSPPETWGPPIWTFIHTLTENINELHFNKIKVGLFTMIKRICLFLPCPDCSNHANLFFMRVDISKMKDKNDFKYMLYTFHNIVSKRKRKQLFHPRVLEKYKYISIPNAFDNFVNVYNTKGNLNLIMESFQRGLVIKDLKLWLYNNHQYFKKKNLENIRVIPQISIQEKEIVETEHTKEILQSPPIQSELLINMENITDISQPKTIDQIDKIEDMFQV
uniref:thiol oxidase n=1 Tax=viral metagenome TaxID=1070528 RepID=A0A6C0DJJ5_9ZZZZ